jgi:hypothetical protein
MKAIKRTVTIEDPRQLTLFNLPFSPGQRIEVLLLAEDETSYHIAELKELFRTTQALPQARRITEAEITAEIAAYRASHEDSY